MQNNAPSMLKPTLIGGLAFGFLGGIPVVGALNCLCCALVMGGGFLAAYLYSKDCGRQGVAFRPGSGAMVGLVAGLFYAIATTVTSGVVNVVMGTSPAGEIEKVREMGMEIPPEMEPFLDFVANANPLLLLAIAFCFSLLLAAVFSTIGGLIGGAVFKVEARPPTSPAGSMPPPPPPPYGGGPGAGGPPA